MPRTNMCVEGGRNKVGISGSQSPESLDWLMDSIHKLCTGKELVDEVRKCADGSNLLVVVRLK